MGAILNKIGNKQDETRISKSRIKYGIIKEVVGRKKGQGVYTVILEIIGSDGKPQLTTKPIPLKEHPMFLAANYGPPDELVGKFVCRIDYKGDSVNRGTASIVRPLTDDKEITEQTNQVAIQGAAFAPPGSGIV
jgi:hypothetical protein